jgi:hypothetical protein
MIDEEKSRIFFSPFFSQKTLARVERERKIPQLHKKLALQKKGNIKQA